jgi:hypothetical protein
MSRSKEDIMSTFLNWLAHNQFAVTKICLEAAIALLLRAFWQSYRRDSVARGAEPTIAGFLGLADFE